ncbi:MAG: tetratricopeptide repeat protein [Ruminococcus sp.]|nr:tetratricopeptide repeat protein [Ruminococcus sp.]
MQDVIASLISDSRLAFIQGKYEESLKLAKKALEMDSKNPDAHQCAGNAYMSFGECENEIKHYKFAVENDAHTGGGAIVRNK